LPAHDGFAQAEPVGLRRAGFYRLCGDRPRRIGSAGRLVSPSLGSRRPQTAQEDQRCLAAHQRHKDQRHCKACLRLRTRARANHLSPEARCRRACLLDHAGPANLVVRGRRATQRHRARSRRHPACPTPCHRLPPTRQCARAALAPTSSPTPTAGFPRVRHAAQGDQHAARRGRRAAQGGRRAAQEDRRAAQEDRRAAQEDRRAAQEDRRAARRARHPARQAVSAPPLAQATAARPPRCTTALRLAPRSSRRQSAVVAACGVGR
jgi:colicin import membrane protein